MQLQILPWHPGENISKLFREKMAAQLQAGEDCSLQNYFSPVPEGRLLRGPRCPALFRSHAHTLLSARISPSSETTSSETGKAAIAVRSCRRRTSQQGTQGHRFRSGKRARTV